MEINAVSMGAEVHVTGGGSVSVLTSFRKTCFNGLNALSGVGILSVPYALSSGGWLSLILFFIVACSALYTGLLIQRCMDMDPNIRSYPDIGQHAFGKIGRTIVSVFMNVELYLVATSFLILEGDNMHYLFPQMKWEISNNLTIGGKECFIVIVSFIILPTVWLNDMNILFYISTCGIIASIVLIFSIFWTAAFDHGVGFHGKDTVLWKWSGIPTAVSLYAFCFCAHPIFPTLYTSMRNQKRFAKVLMICFILCTITYGSVAVMGYLMFGSNLSSQITLNLPINKISSKVAIYTTLINPIAKYALMVMPIIHAIEKKINSNSRKRRRWLELLIRTILVFTTVIVALAIPFFGYLMALVGAFLSMSASILLPCICFLKISHGYRKFGVEVVIIACIMVMGISIMIVGTYTSVKEIATHFVSRVENFQKLLYKKGGV